MLNEGTYMATVVAHGIKKHEGYKPQLFIVFRDDDSGGQMTWFHGMGQTSKGFNPKAYDYCVNQLSSLGWDAKENDFAFGRLGLTDELVGRQAQIVVKNDTYNGKTRTKIAYINNPSAAPEKIDPNQEIDFFKELRANAYKAEAGRGAREQERRAAPKEKKQPSDSESSGWGAQDYDDIPF